MAARLCRQGLILTSQHLHRNVKVNSILCCQARAFSKVSNGFFLNPVTTPKRQFHVTPMSLGVTPINMPSLSPTMTEGTIVKWLKKEGDTISAGDVVCEIQTDKAVVSLELEEEGILAKILIGENAPEVKVGSLIGVIVDEGEDWKNVSIPQELLSSSSSEGTPAQPPAQPAQATSQPSHAPSHGVTSDFLVGPAARTLLAHYGIQAQEVGLSNHRSALLKGDVLRHVQEKGLRPVDQNAVSKKESASTTTARGKKQKGPPYVDIELTSMRKTIAKRLLESKSSIPHSYGAVRCSINNLMSIRKSFQAAGVKASVNDFVIKCTGNALSRVPSVNVVWEGSNIVLKSRCDISIAVATESGLITPIVTDVGDKDVLQISDNVRSLAEKAKNGKLQPSEFLGGTFTISNLGMFGIYQFSAIINPPQCAILAVGGGHTNIRENGKPDTSISLNLSYDARAISEDTAAKFLALLKHEIENPTEASLGVFNLQSRLEYSSV